ncbi:hypothetical protein DAPPUDRAFT_315390 [Daphnia pulex]|uniref:Replication factor-A protein 1 N-terminal domain-containing protein n=1 Tax=Daphnia pulex TaxID=6669 RepID=E9G9L2_DAPPU|nr:hypothetical protein DAPPUDRAFT_341257 [Daphnia pulex]EFX83584.1 hypothetical protein DAPPUDRAFT_315390 [Daphnia pulex]|eukprot:EFX60819.1 hypothetical protein DAPPUDRAFT_341257 [Daphnia pulex]
MPNENPILQVFGNKSLPEDNSDRYRLLISDGKYSYAYGMLVVSLNYLTVDGQLENFTIIRAKKFPVNNVATKATAGKDKRKLLIFWILNLLWLEVGEILGNPQTLNDDGETFTLLEVLDIKDVDND